MVSEAEFLVHLIGQIYDAILDQTYGLVFWKPPALKLPVNPSGKYIYRTIVCIIARVHNELIVKGEMYR
jgi:hypothetical protein